MAEHDEGQNPTRTARPVDRAVLRQIVDVLREPAFLITDTGRLLHRNAAARSWFDPSPDWLAACAGGNGAPRPRWARCVSVDPATTLVVVDSMAGTPEDAKDAPWVDCWKLPPRLARVTACLACGLSDKEIAARLGIGYQTVRTYVKQVYQRTKLRSRAEVARAVHDGDYLRKRREKRG